MIATVFFWITVAVSGVIFVVTYFTPTQTKTGVALAPFYFAAVTALAFWMGL